MTVRSAPRSRTAAMICAACRSCGLAGCAGFVQIALESVHRPPVLSFRVRDHLLELLPLVRRVSRLDRRGERIADRAEWYR